MANQRTLWKFRVRSSMTPTRGVDLFVVETDTDDMNEGDRLARWATAHHFPSPGTVFIGPVQRFVLATSADMRAAQAAANSKPVEDEPKGPSVAQAMSRDDMPETARQQSAGGAKPGRVGA